LRIFKQGERCPSMTTRIYLKNLIAATCFGWYWAILLSYIISYLGFLVKILFLNKSVMSYLILITCDFFWVNFINVSLTGNVVSIHPTLTPVQLYWLSPRLLIATPRAPSHIESTLRYRIFSFSDCWPLKIGPIRCPETTVNHYHTTPRNIPQERRSYDILSPSSKFVIFI
jgi:hypothetical protein